MFYLSSAVCLVLSMPLHEAPENTKPLVLTMYFLIQGLRKINQMRSRFAQ